MQTNALPNHCFNALLSNPSSQEYDFTVTFNPDVSGSALNYDEASIDTSNEVSELLCDIQRTAAVNMPSTSTFTNNNMRRELQQGGNPPPCHPDCPPREDGMGPPPDGQGGPGGPMDGNDPLATASGIYITGAVLFNALDGDQMDAVQEEYRTLDVCLSHPSPFG